MKKLPLMLTIALSSTLLSAPAFASCFTNQTIEYVDIGYVDGRQKHGPDSGNAVVFKTSDGRVWPLNSSYNLNHDRGRALYSILQTALVTGLRVSGWDHHGTRCDDIDQIRILKD